MTVSSAAAPPAHSRELEVKLLVDMVRLSRVTLLIAEPGSEKSGLLRSNVMPLLTHGGRGQAEVAILFDAWDKPPLPALRARIEEAVGAQTVAAAKAAGDSKSLVPSLKAWQEALGVTFLIIFDRFEEYLRMPTGRVGVTEFEDDFVQAVNDPGIRANFLLSLDEAAEPLLNRLRERVPRLGYSRVRVPCASPLSPSPASESKASVPPPTSPPVSLRVAPAAATAQPTPKESSIVRAAQAEPARRRTVAAAVKPHASPSAAPSGASPRARGERGAHGEEVAKADPPESKVVAAAQTPASPKAAITAVPRQSAESVAHAEPVAESNPAKPKIAAVSQTPVPLELAPIAVVARQPAERRSGQRASAPKRRLTRFAWVPVALLPVALFVFLQPTLQPPAGRTEERATAERASTLARSKAAAEPAQRPAPSGESPQNAAAVTADRQAAARALPSAPPAPAALSPAVPPMRTAEVATPAPARAAAAVAAGAGPSVPAPKSAPAVSSASVRTAPPAQPVRPPESAVAQTPLASSTSSAVATAPVQRVARPDAVAKAARAARSPSASSEAPSGPALYINVRNEAQRAWVERMVKPLGERGIRVAGIRIVSSGPNEPDVRYFRLAERDEALKVAVALRDLGLLAQQLKHVEELETPGTARQYELWLPATGYDQRP